MIIFVCYFSELKQNNIKQISQNTKQEKIRNTEQQYSKMKIHKNQLFFNNASK